MKPPEGFRTLRGSKHSLSTTDKFLGATAKNEPITFTFILRRRPGATKLAGLEEFSAKPAAVGNALSRDQFAATYGADADEMNQVKAFAETNGFHVLGSYPARRAVVVQGTVGDVNKAFAVKLGNYKGPLGKYRSHGDAINIPTSIAGIVEAVTGLHERPVPAKHFSTARRQNPADPPNTKPLTPAQVAQLYNFPAGDGSGQTIGLYEMETGEGRAGYTKQDLANTMQAFGGELKVPSPIDVSVDGISNSGVSDGETGLDITVASAIAQGAKIAVYFTGPTPQNIIHAIQRMVHPAPGDPDPTVISISYGWGPDDATSESFSENDYNQLDQLFQDAANLGITVLVSSGDSGALIASKTQAQTSYPASEPWVIACGGTTIGNVNHGTFVEYVWNDTGAAGPGATGGGVSARFPVPPYQAGAKVPKRNGTGTIGRGVPDIAGNASENSGYLQVINGQRAQPVGGTSAVAPLYAGLIARINANLGYSVGFINSVLYSLSATAFRDICSPPGPDNNSLDGVKGYPATSGWNACTGLGSVNGTALQKGLLAAHTASQKIAAAAPMAPPKVRKRLKVPTF